MLDLRALRACLDLFRQRAWSGWYHINLFPSTVLNTPTDRIIQLFLEAGAIDGVCIELSEQQFLGNPVQLREAVQKFRNNAIRVAIDDAGFGRSFAEALVVLEPEIVKVDRRRVSGIASHFGQRRELERFLTMLRAVDIQVIVKGVENREDLRVLNEMGVPYGQGFLWGKPTEAG